MLDGVIDTLCHITETFWDKMDAHEKKGFAKPAKPAKPAYLAECLKIIEFAEYKKNSADWKTCMRYVNRKLDL